MDTLRLFLPITKVDEEKRLVYGTLADEAPDHAGEVFDYASSKPHFVSWSGEFEKLTDGKSLGNVRAMHNTVAAGKLTSIEFGDDAKKIEAVAKIVDDAEWKKCLEGIYTGFSVGGKYEKRWQDGKFVRYTARPHEVSLVDKPCIPTATFSMIKADGTTEARPFKVVPLEEQVELLKAEIVTLKTLIASRDEAESTEVKAMLEKIEALRKTMAEITDEMVKGHSKDTLSKIQGIHDHATGLGAKCATEKADMAEDLKKVQTEKDEALAKVATLTTERDDLKKQVDTLTAENKKLAETPEPPKGVTKVIGKADDAPVVDKEAEAMKKAEEAKDPAAMVKAIHSNPRMLG